MFLAFGFALLMRPVAVRRSEAMVLFIITVFKNNVALRTADSERRLVGRLPSVGGEVGSEFASNF